MADLKDFEADDHLEVLRSAAQIAERHESEMRTKLGETAERYACGSRTQAELAEMAECYVAVKRACQSAQERYHKAAWKTQARAAIKQGQTLADFVDHCEQSNRPIARKAYLAVRKEQGFIY